MRGLTRASLCISSFSRMFRCTHKTSVTPSYIFLSNFTSHLNVIRSESNQSVDRKNASNHFSPLFISLFLLLNSIPHHQSKSKSKWVVEAQLIPAKFDGFVHGNPKKFNPESILIEAFFDPVCPDTRDSWPPLKKVLHFYGSKVSLIVHPFPLPYHDNAFATSRAVHIVNGLNSSATYPLWESFFKDQYGCSRGVYGTPAFFVNGFLLPDVGSPIDYNGWKKIIDPLVKAKRNYGLIDHHTKWVVEVEAITIPAKSDGFVHGNPKKYNPESVLIEAFFDPLCPYSRDSWPPLREALHFYGSNVYHKNAFTASRAIHVVNELNSSATFPLWESFFKHQYACSRGVFGTPTFFVNGFPLADDDSPSDYKGWRKIIDPLVHAKGKYEFH
ncbi:L-2 4-diaminobutyric acid acetyltransferase [Bienertia sinuspersici]